MKKKIKWIRILAFWIGALSLAVVILNNATKMIQYYMFNVDYRLVNWVGLIAFLISILYIQFEKRK